MRVLLEKFRNEPAFVGAVFVALVTAISAGLVPLVIAGSAVAAVAQAVLTALAVPLAAGTAVRQSVTPGGAEVVVQNVTRTEGPPPAVPPRGEGPTDHDALR